MTTTTTTTMDTASSTSIYLPILSLSLSLLLLLFLFLHVTYNHNHRNPSPNPPTNPPHPIHPIKGRPKYRVLMDVRKLDPRNWLTIDENYLSEHRVRDVLLRAEKSSVLQCLPESGDACEEVLEEVVGFLCGRVPGLFARVGRDGRDGKEVVVNRVTGERFRIGDGKQDGEQSEMGALEVAVRLAMEDLSILMLNEEGEYYLAASASLFPVGWTVKERIGWTISKLHDPVPLWHEQVSTSVRKFLTRLTPTNPMERSNYFIEVRPPHEPLLDTLYRPNGLVEENMDPDPHDIIIRRERQTFRRLPRTGAIVFGVKTVLTPLDELPVEELRNLATEIKSWPECVGEYKGKAVWGGRALEYCKERVGREGNEKIEV